MGEAPWRRRFRAATMSLPRWARDEPDRLIYSSNAGGKWELYGWDLTTGRQWQLTDREEGTRAGSIDPLGQNVWWFDDNKGDELGRWIVRPFAGGNGDGRPIDLPPAYSTGLAVGSTIAVAGSSDAGGVAVHVLENGGSARLVYSHDEYASVDGLSRDESMVVLSHTEHGDAMHPALKVLRLDGSFVGELWDGPGLGLEAAGWSPVSGDPRLLVLHERRDFSLPVVWNTITGDVQDLDVDLPGDLTAAWWPDAEALLLTHHRGGRDEMFHLDLTGGRLTAIGSDPGCIPLARVRPDGTVWYAWTNAATPLEIRSTSGQVVIRPPGEPAPSGVDYADDFAGSVHYFVAEPPSGRPHPTIFAIHGGPTAHDRDAFGAHIQAWIDHGFAVVLVNYRGSTGYGRSWRDALLGNPGLTELEDIAAVHEQVVSSGIADPRRTILSGGSWGGYLTLLGLGHQPERWSLGIADVPVGDFVAAYEDEMEPLRAYDRTLFGGTPDELPDVYRERSPITYADRVSVPLLILAGTNDARCPIRSIDNYIARLKEMDKPHEVYRYDAGHGSLVIGEQIRQTEIRISFAARHLGTSPPL